MCSSDLNVLKQNLAIVKNFTPMTAEDMTALRNRCRALAGDGHLELFKTTTMYDGKIGREQHGFPTTEEMPA